MMKIVFIFALVVIALGCASPDSLSKHLLVRWTQPDDAEFWRGWVRRVKDGRSDPDSKWQSVGEFTDVDWIEQPTLLDSSLYKFVMVAVRDGVESPSAPNFVFRGDGVKAFRFIRD